MGIQGLNGDQFGAKWNAYEQAMARGNDFGLKGKEVAEQMGRYAEGLQYDQMKAINKAQGREYARMLAEEQQALTNGLAGKSAVSTNPLNLTSSNNGINVVRKTQVGTKKTGFKYFFVDDTGKVYQVDKSAYNAIAQKGNIKLNGKMGNPVSVKNLPKKVLQQFNKYMNKRSTVTANAASSSGMTITEEGRKIRDKIDEILHRPTDFSPENLDKWSGHGPNPGMDHLNNWYRDLEQADNVVTNNKLETLTGKFDEFGNRFNNIDDHLGRIDGKVDGIYQNVEKLKRGIGEANGKIIGKIDDVAQNVTVLTDKVDDVSQNVSKLKRGLGEVSGKIIGKVDDNTKALSELANKVDDLAKGNKKMALIGGAIALAGAAVAGIAGYLLGKKAGSDDKVNAEETTPVVTTPEDEIRQEETPVVTTPEDEIEQEEITPIVTPPVVTVPEEEQEKEEVPPVETIDPNSPVDADGKMTVKKGDGLWHLAKRYLEYNFKNEPEKFENLSENEQHKLILKEVYRIAKLNEFKLVTKVINGKVQVVTEPMIHPGDKIQIIKKMDTAA